MLFTLGAYLIGALFAFGLFETIRFFWTNAQSPLHELRGPIHESAVSLQGDLDDMRDTYVSSFGVFFSNPALSLLKSRPVIITAIMLGELSGLKNTGQHLPCVVLWE
jgi:hypothetical protein